MKILLSLLILASSAFAQNSSINGVGTQSVTASPAYVAGGGSANAQTATYAPAVTTLQTGLTLCWLPTAANSTTTPTFAPNGLTAKTITKTGTAALAASDLTTTAVACAIYDGTEWQLQNPQTASGGSGAMTNITSLLTASGCTTASGQCVVGTPGSVISFSSIPGTYRSLEIFITAGTSAGTSQCVYMQANGDTAAHYNGQSLYGAGTGTGADNPVSTSTVNVACITGTNVANMPGTIKIHMDLYANTTWVKNALAETYRVSVSFNSGAVLQLFAWNWNSTAAITSLSFTLGSGNFVAGSNISVYGIN